MSFARSPRGPIAICGSLVVVFGALSWVRSRPPADYIEGYLPSSFSVGPCTVGGAHLHLDADRERILVSGDAWGHVYQRGDDHPLADLEVAILADEIGPVSPFFSSLPNSTSDHLVGHRSDPTVSSIWGLPGASNYYLFSLADPTDGVRIELPAVEDLKPLGVTDDGRVVGTVDYSVIYLWNPFDPVTVEEMAIPFSAGPRARYFHMNARIEGQLLVLPFEDAVVVLDFATGESTVLEAEGHRIFWDTVIMSPTRVASVATEGPAILVWDLDAPTQPRVIDLKQDVRYRITLHPWRNDPDQAYETVSSGFERFRPIVAIDESTLALAELFSTITVFDIDQPGMAKRGSQLGQQDIDRLEAFANGYIVYSTGCGTRIWDHSEVPFTPYDPAKSFYGD